MPDDQPAAHAVQQPADIGRELLRLRPRQQHAEVERVQEARLVDPLLLVDHDAMHHGDLAGRAAEIDAADLEPDLEELAEGRVCAPAVACVVSSWSRRLGRPVVALRRGKAQIGEQCIVDHEALLQQAMIVVAGQQPRAPSDTRGSRPRRSGRRARARPGAERAAPVSAEQRTTARPPVPNADRCRSTTKRRVAVMANSATLDRLKHGALHVLAASRAGCTRSR